MYDIFPIYDSGKVTEPMSLFLHRRVNLMQRLDESTSLHVKGKSGFLTEIFYRLHSLSSQATAWILF